MHDPECAAAAQNDRGAQGDAPHDAPKQEIHGGLVEIMRLWNAYLYRRGRKTLEFMRVKVQTISTTATAQGLADVAAVALAMGLKLDTLLASEHRPDEDQLHSMKHLLASLAHTIGSRGQNTPDYVTKSVSEIAPRPPLQRVEEILVVNPNVSAAMWLARQICGFGYQARGCTTLDHLAAALEQRRPAAVILDVSLVMAGHEEPPGMLAATLNGQLLLVSGPDGFVPRLAAAKAGAAAYVAHPLNAPQVVDTLDSLLATAHAAPYRILIVDDDPTLSRVYELVLQEKGWITRLVADPLTVLDAMVDFNPDLIILDMNMPQVSGAEVAAVIRQYENFVSIPIVYLSMEDDISKQLRAISHGADDFLSKTMRPDHLVAAIESRVRRYRVLRSHLSRDGLTGLLNHASLTRRLENEVIRVRRSGGKLAFAMLDLDRFKTVNDTHGHLVGDKVLKAVAKLLKQRLRVTDLIGRYGGEEFAVILLDVVDAAYAAQVMDAIRVAFSEVIHQSDTETFQVTLSCGLAVYPHFSTAAELVEAADKALYEAKRTGRNRLVLASTGQDALDKRCRAAADNAEACAGTSAARPDLDL